MNHQLHQTHQLQASNHITKGAYTQNLRSSVRM